MSDEPRDKYEILDLIFTLFHSICMSLAAIFLLSNLIVSLILVFVVVFFTLSLLYFWRAQNPFNIYLIRALAINNLFFTFIALIYYYSLLSVITPSPVVYVLLLFPSGLYLLISFKFSSIPMTRDKKAGLMLAYSGNTKAARRIFIRENPVEGSEKN